MANPMHPAKVNSPKTELAATIAADATTIAVVDVTKLPAAPNLCTILNGDDSETFSYAAISGNNLTGCVRGLNGTAKAWTAGMKVARTYTAYDHDTFIEQINEIVGKLVAASTTKAGLVQLSDAITSTATDRAATANAIKKAVDTASQDATTKANAAKNDAQKYTSDNAALKRTTTSDYDTMTEYGVYTINQANTAHGPTDNPQYAILLVFVSGLGYITQILVNIFTGKMYKRTRTETTWQSWTYVIDSSQIMVASGQPEGVVNASPGTMYLNTAGGTSTTLYIKESGGGNSGWKAK